LRIEFLASTNWRIYLGLSEIGKNKKEKDRIRNGDGKNNATILED